MISQDGSGGRPPAGPFSRGSQNRGSANRG